MNIRSIYQPSTTDFAELQQHPEYIDNTLLIHDLETSAYISNAILMPSGFFKSSALSMLHYFYDKDLSRSDLFTGKDIEKHQRTLAHQGKYIVIHLDFSDIKGETWEVMFALIQAKMSLLYVKYQPLFIKEESLTKRRKERYQSIIDQQANQSVTQSSLEYLTQDIHNVSNKKLVILIDNFDEPILEAMAQGYATECRHFFGSFYAFLTHDMPPHIYRTVLMGKCHFGFYRYNNSIYSSVHNQKLGLYFGMTRRAVAAILKRHQLPAVLRETLTDYYGGHHFDRHLLHHPASIWAGIQALLNINCMPMPDNLMPLTSAQMLRQMISSDQPAKKTLSRIVQDCSLVHKDYFPIRTIDPTIGLPGATVLFYLAYFGLLTHWEYTDTRDEGKFSFCIPNRSAYNFIVTNLFRPHTLHPYQAASLNIKREYHAYLNALAQKLWDSTNDQALAEEALTDVNNLQRINIHGPLMDPLYALAQSLNHVIRTKTWAFFDNHSRLRGSKLNNSFMPRASSLDQTVATAFKDQLKRANIPVSVIDEVNIKSTATVLAQSYRKGGFFRAYTKDQLIKIASANQCRPKTISDEDALRIATFTINRHTK